VYGQAAVRCLFVDEEEFGMLSRWSRWTSLTGVVFVVLVVLGGPILEGSTPGSKATGAQVISFFETHRSRERASAILLTVAFIVFLFFASSVRRTPGVEGRLRLALDTGWEAPSWPPLRQHCARPLLPRRRDGERRD
jgi:hypothetical protein